MAVVSVLTVFNMVFPKLQKGALYNSVMKLPMFEEMKGASLIRTDGGEKARFPMIVDTPSDPTEIDLTNTDVVISGRDIHDTADAAWGTRVFPLILRNEVLRRLSTPEQVKDYIKDFQTALNTGRSKGYYRQLIVGNMPGYTRYGTLNGAVSGLSAEGLEYGAFYFDTPANQAAASITYLSRRRQYDSTLGSFAEDNWYNHYGTHNGIGVDFIETAEGLKADADQFGDGKSDSVQALLVNQTNYTAIMSEFRSTVGGNSTVVYTPADVAAGKALVPVNIVAGMKLCPTPVVRLLEAATGRSEIGIGLNPMSFMQLINRDKNATVYPVKDWMPDKGRDVSVGFEVESNQLACRSLPRNFIMELA